jgi:outer membrane lipoprotein SlyB
MALGGCATLPMGPSVMVLPAPGKSFEQFQADDAVCRQWAAQQVGPPGAPATRNTALGAALGTALGAGLGAAMGAGSGHAGTGAAIGAGAGLVGGTAVGANADQASGGTAQRRYDMAYQQCMYAKGNQILGVVQPARPPAPPPPPPPGYSPASPGPPPPPAPG